MNISEILKLIDAGYTKEEIEAMDKEQTPAGDDEKNEHPEEKEDLEEKPTPAGDAEKNEHPAEITHDDETRKLIQALDLKFNNLVSAIQATNVNKMEMPTDTMTAESIIAGMIDPQYNKKGEK